MTPAHWQCRNFMAGMSFLQHTEAAPAEAGTITTASNPATTQGKGRYQIHSAHFTAST